MTVIFFYSTVRKVIKPSKKQGSGESQYTLASVNGIPAVFYPIRDLPAVKVDLISRAGGWYENGQEWGAYHYLEHLVHNGTEKFPKTLDLEYFKEDNGLQSNAYTGGGQLGFWTKAPAYNLKQALTLLNEIVFHPRLDEGYFAKELDVITQEYEDKWDSPYVRFGRELSKQFFGTGHPYTHDGLGQPEYIKSLSRSQLLDLHHRAFAAPNLVLAVTGNFNLDEALSLALSVLTPVADDHIILPYIKEYPIVDIPHTLVHHEVLNQEQIIIRWPLPGDNQSTIRDRIIYNIARYMLGGSARSLIFQELRERRGLIYRGGSNLCLYPEAGYFEVWVSTTPKNRPACISLLQELVYGFINNPLNLEAFNRAIRYMDASTVVNFDSIDAIASHIVNDHFWNNHIYLPDELIAVSRTVSPKDVIASLQPYLNPSRAFLSVLSSQKDLSL